LSKVNKMAVPEQAMLRARKTKAAKRPTGSDVKAHLATMDRTGLMALIRDLYDLDALNRRALHARFASDGTTFNQYRRLVRTAVFPDPLTGTNQSGPKLAEIPAPLSGPR
jgi:hypothetical protein